MDIYIGAGYPLNFHSSNLFALRSDLYMGQFDAGAFVIVPKSNQLLIHFLKISEEGPDHFHNVTFEHDHKISPHLLYARFAWAVLKIVSEGQPDPGEFRFAEEDTNAGMQQQERVIIPARVCGDNDNRRVSCRGRGPSGTRGLRGGRASRGGRRRKSGPLSKPPYKGIVFIALTETY